jgi:hypothetical protein
MVESEDGLGEMNEQVVKIYEEFARDISKYKDKLNIYIHNPITEGTNIAVEPTIGIIVALPNNYGILPALEIRAKSEELAKKYGIRIDLDILYKSKVEELLRNNKLNSIEQILYQ